MTTDVWSVRIVGEAEKFYAAAGVTAGSIPLLTEEVASNGVGYRIAILSAGDDSGVTFTIRGVVAGSLTGTPTTEAVTGAAVGTSASDNYYSRILSITASGNSAGDVSIGTSVADAAIALPRTRIKGVYFMNDGAAAEVAFARNADDFSNSNYFLHFAVPDGTTAAAYDNVIFPGDGVLTTRSGVNDYCVMYVGIASPENVTVFCG